MNDIITIAHIASISTTWNALARFYSVLCQKDKCGFLHNGRISILINKLCRED